MNSLQSTETEGFHDTLSPCSVCGHRKVNSLANKIDELAALVKNVMIYRGCSLLCFTETWLTPRIPDLSGIITVRADRDTKVCVKIKGGGLAMFIKCNPRHVTVKMTHHRSFRFTSPHVCKLKPGVKLFIRSLRNCRNSIQ